MYFYNPRAASILESIHASGHVIVPLGSLTKEVFLPNRFTRVRASAGVPYLDSEDIFKINPEVTKFIGRITRGDAERYCVRKGWILLARSGQIYGVNGSTMLANKWHEGKIVSEHIIRVVPDDTKIRAGYLHMAMGHPVFSRPLVLRMSFGTEVPEIAPDDVADFPVVRLGRQTEDAIADGVERASELRSQADAMENETIVTVGRAIDEMLGGALPATPELPEQKPPAKPKRAKLG